LSSAIVVIRTLTTSIVPMVAAAPAPTARDRVA
jgi:hypothetical protein